MTSLAGCSAKCGDLLAKFVKGGAVRMPGGSSILGRGDASHGPRLSPISPGSSPVHELLGDPAVQALLDQTWSTPAATASPSRREATEDTLAARLAAAR
jgi:hypothetical protein